MLYFRDGDWAISPSLFKQRGSAPHFSDAGDIAPSIFQDLTRKFDETFSKIQFNFVIWACKYLLT